MPNLNPERQNLEPREMPAPETQAARRRPRTLRPRLIAAEQVREAKEATKKIGTLRRSLQEKHEGIHDYTERLKQEMDDLFAKEEAIRQQIREQVGHSIKGNTAEEIRANLGTGWILKNTARAAWSGFTNWVSKLAGQKEVAQRSVYALLRELGEVQQTKVNKHTQLRKVEPPARPPLEVRRERRITARAAKEMGALRREMEEPLPGTETLVTEELARTENEPITAAPSTVDSPQSTVTEAEVLTAKDVMSESEAFERDMTYYLGFEPDSPVFKHRDDPALKNDLEQLLSMARQEEERVGAMEEEMGRLEKNKNKTNRPFFSLIRRYQIGKMGEKWQQEYESRRANLVSRAEALEAEENRLSEITDAEITPESDREREKRLKLQDAISGFPRQEIPSETADVLTAEDIIPEGGVFKLPGRYKPTKEEIPIEKRVLLETELAQEAAAYNRANEMPPTLRGKEKTGHYEVLRHALYDQFDSLVKRDPIRYKPLIDKYVEFAAQRDHALRKGDKKTAHERQESINNINAMWRGLGYIGQEDPSVSLGGKSSGLKYLGGEHVAERMAAHPKNIPSLRRPAARLEKVAGLKTQEAPLSPLTPLWATSRLGEVAAQEWDRLVPLIQKSEFRFFVYRAMNELMDQVEALEGLSDEYHHLKGVLKTVQADPKFTACPEAATYIYLKAFRPQNKADHQAQALIDETISTVDNFLISPEQRAERAAQQARERDQQAAQVGRAYLETKAASAKQAAREAKERERQAAEVGNAYLEKKTQEAEERRMAQESAERRTEALAVMKHALKEPDVISREQYNNLLELIPRDQRPRYVLALNEFLAALKAKNKKAISAKAQALRTLNKEFGIEQQKPVKELMALTKSTEAPKAKKQPRTARARTARAA